jgi:hypothetical protein
MLQFYFLSIFANFLAGVALTSDYLTKKIRAFEPFQDLFGKRGTRIALGSLAAVVGFLKLLIRSTNNDAFFVGDLLPALAGLGMGAALLFDVLKEKSEVPSENMGKLEKAVVTYRVPLGITGIVISALHFLIPSALFL